MTDKEVSKIFSTNMGKMQWLILGMGIMHMVNQADYIVDTVAEPTILDLFIVTGGAFTLWAALLVVGLSLYLLVVWMVGMSYRTFSDDDSFMEVVVPAFIWPHTALMEKIKG